MNSHIHFVAPFRNAVLSAVLRRIEVGNWSMGTHTGNREFKKLRPLLQRKRHIKIELCVSLSVLRLFHICHVI